MAYSIRFDQTAIEDLSQLRKRDQTTLLENVQRFLTHSPGTEQGRRIKRLHKPAISDLRLRVGDFRVYYDVDDEAQEVHVLRVARKGTRTTEETLE